MRYDAVFFDFDGTLVRSADAKRASFFCLFPDTADYRTIVEDVLNKYPDESRYIVIPIMLERMKVAGLNRSQKFESSALMERYGQIVHKKVSDAEAMEGAEELLQLLLVNNVRLFLFSNTPHEALITLARSRNWEKYFDNVSGYPVSKTAFITTIMAEYNLRAERVAVVGDGASDRDSAKRTGADIYVVERDSDLRAIGRQIDRVTHV